MTDPNSSYVTADTVHFKPLRPERRLFFDTNFVIRREEDLPAISQSGTESSWITEATRNEVLNILGEVEGGKAIAPYKVLTFDDLYQQDPTLCPVYYHFLQAMLNPANLGSEEFWDDFMLAKIRRRDTISSEELSAYESLKRRSSSSQSVYPNGLPKDQDYKNLEAIGSEARRKARRAARHQHANEMNDSRTLALILYQALKTRCDAVLYTTDGDMVELLISWIESMSMALTLMSAIEKNLTDAHCQALARREKVEIALDYEKFVHERHKCMMGLSYNNTTPLQVMVRVKLWNISERRFERDDWTAVEDDVADCLSRLYGAGWCHFSANNFLFNWIKYEYPGPPAKGKPLIVKLTSKNLVTENDAIGQPLHLHNAICNYRKMDAENNAAFFSAFVPQPVIDLET